MHYLNSFALLALSFPIVAHSKALYIDSSCTSKAGWDGYWKESQNFAKRGVERMKSGSDTDFETVFKRIFRTEKDSTDGKYVQGIMGQIAGLTTEKDLKKSEIRLFCDNDKRWGEKRPTGGWYDKTNEMVTKNEPSCLTNGVLGRAYERKSKAPADENSPRAGHNANRIVVTICDDTFVSIGELPLMISDDIKNDDLQGSQIGFFSYVVAQTIVHELAHAMSANSGKFEVKDLPDKEHAYGWENVIAKESEVAIKNADNYAFLALWAAVGDLGYTLPRINEKGISEADKKERENDSVKGYLTKFADITKRMLKAVVARSFSA